jgi:hemerythrin-like domain-containing protein
MHRRDTSWTGGRLATRRRLLLVGGAMGVSLAAGQWTARAVAAPRGKKASDEEEISPAEDLMREHGVLDRVLLIYEAAMRKLDAREEFDPAAITQSAQVVRDFIESYHEMNEEQQVFPRFKRANQMVDLVATLLAQHEAGRKVTASILRLAPNSRRDGDDRRQLVGAMRSFMIMYRPHAAREDTDLFPKLRSLVSQHEYDAMAEQFERTEKQTFGEDGFEKMVDRVAQIERMVGIDDLAKFTPA